MFLFLTPPRSFPEHTFFTVARGETLRSVSQRLSDEHIVRSRILFQMFVIIRHRDRHIPAGEYFLDRPLFADEVGRRFANGDFHYVPVKVTFPEGVTREKIAAALAPLLPNFKLDEFLGLTKNTEGYLFPDTYFFPPNATTDMVVRALAHEFDEQMKPIHDDISKSKFTLPQIITLASIVEREAAGENDRALIAGILEHRLAIGMPLGADATIAYVFSKDTKQVTHADTLINSPYNTYRIVGLPPTPIANPGIASIRAVLHPEGTEYLYYLHDTDGIIHPAKTFAEHKVNIAKYLR